MEPENHASLMGRKLILARGTPASSFGKRGSRFAALRLSKYAMTAAPNARTDAIGTVRSRRQASTAPSRPPGFAVEYPPRSSNSATRSRLASGCDGSGSFPVEAWTQRSYRSEEHTSELQSLTNRVCRLLL